MSDALPDNWATSELRDILASDFPGAWGDDPSSRKANVNVLRSTNLDDEGHLDYSTGALRFFTFRDLERKRLSSGDILLEASGGGPGKPVGRVALFRQTDDQTYACSNFFRTLRPTKDVDCGYLAWYLQWVYSQPNIWKFQQQTTGIINLKYKDYLRQPIALPDLTEQRMISKILDTADEVIRSTELIIDKLEQAKQGIVHDLLTRGISEFGDLRDPSRSDTFVGTKLGLVPRDWRIVSVTDTASKSRGSLVIGPFGSDLVASDYRNSGVPVIFVRDVRPDDFTWISEVYLSVEKATELSEHKVRPGDLVITKMGLPPAIAAVYPDGLPTGIVTADIIRLRPDDDTVTSFWLSLAINSDSTRRQIAAITGGVTRPKITLRDFRRILIALPSRGEQQAISDLVQTLMSELAAVRWKRDKLLLLKRGLLDDLLTGRVRVGASG